MTVTTRVPLDIGAIHFIGIGGIGMSGIAEIMHNLGYKVQGSRRFRKRQCQAPARHGHSPSPSATAPTISKTRMPWSIPPPSSPAMSSSTRRAR